jgi:hypothetical protein
MLTGSLCAYAGWAGLGWLSGLDCWPGPVKLHPEREPVAIHSPTTAAG